MHGRKLIVADRKSLVAAVEHTRSRSECIRAPAAAHMHMCGHGVFARARARRSPSFAIIRSCRELCRRGRRSVRQRQPAPMTLCSANINMLHMRHMQRRHRRRPRHASRERHCTWAYSPKVCQMVAFENSWRDYCN